VGIDGDVGFSSRRSAHREVTSPVHREFGGSLQLGAENLANFILVARDSMGVGERKKQVDRCRHGDEIRVASSIMGISSLASTGFLVEC
jgi:hypothetical protein